ncbi:MAG TPA: asparagine synthase C-terminal domain-containing protein [Ramlibacter sp.]|nr:asparagine synthase C-terminal domain-containing protein [Ramlibacter sp.]
MIYALRDAYRAEAPPTTAKQLRETLMESVADHMIADVPVAVALSGGLDSSIVAFAAAEVHPDLDAFTFTLSGEKDPEVEHAALLCRQLGLRHRVARLVPNETSGWLRRVAWHMEEPIANVNALVSYGLGAVLRQHRYKVVMVGEGSDELFGGYPWYRLALDPSLLSREAVFDAYRKRRAQSRSSSFLRPQAVATAERRAAEQRAAFARVASASRLGGFLAYDQETQLQYSQLLRVDRMFMAHGVEARVPFLYRPVLQASAGIPPSGMFAPPDAGGRTEKVALAEAFAGLLPAEVVSRPKFGEQGTVNIWDTWLAAALTDDLDRCLHGAELRGARQLLEEFIDWKALAAGQLSPKERFAVSLLIESVDAVMLSREAPDGDSPVKWEVLG